MPIGKDLIFVVVPDGSDVFEVVEIFFVGIIIVPWAGECAPV